MSDVPPSAGPSFDPITHGFVSLAEHRPPGGVQYYEFRNHVSVDGSADYRRLNLYLTQDGKFVTIWWGCLDDIFITTLFHDAGLEPSSYDEPLFRGHIESDEQARHILRALRLDGRFPQVLRRDASKGVVCEAADETVRSS